MKIKVLSFGLLLFLAQSTTAQTAPPANLAVIKQQLNKMQVLGSVLYIAAHPDDENTRLLAYLAQEKHYRTGYLALTRGDGGQNLIGNEQSEQLGLIRTQELLAARRVDGAEQFFSRANDFGFSKGPEETLNIWNREKILGDVVWVIRKFRPDVMICRFPTTGEGGHGHHTSSAILAQEAFTAASDPKRFPEQLKYVQPWQAKRLLWNTFNFGSTNTTAEDQFKIDVGVYNPYLGKGYGEIAAESRSNHKTQGFGTANQRGQIFEYFKTILGDAPNVDLMDGINTTWGRVQGGAEITTNIEIIKKNFDDAHPEKSVPALAQLLTRINKVNDAYWRKQKIKELSDLLTACAGLWFEAYVAEPTYAVGDSMNVRLQMISRYGANIKFDSFSATPAAGMVPVKGPTLAANQLQTINTRVKAENISQPYWLESPHTLGTYTINDETKVGNPENPDAPKITFNFVIAGVPVSITRKLMYKYVDQARGEIYQPVEITPHITANIANKVYVYSSHELKPQTVQVSLKCFVNGSGTVSLKPVDGWKISPQQIPFSDKKKGDEWTAEFVVTPADGKPKNNVLAAIAEINGQKSSLGILRIRYDHIPNITLFPPAETKLVDIDLTVKGKKIGYIAGAGDQVPDALKQVGYDVHFLTENEIMNGDLSGYDAIVAGVRAYNINLRLVLEQPKLLDYVKNGGTYLVQYNVFSPLVMSQVGPYPFTIVNQRVTDENAKVTFVQPDVPALNYPNKITQTDFDGWVQERGLYFVSHIDPKYQTPLSMNDPGEAPNKGSLVLTDYGKGRFVYTSLDFFRELPAGVPGAYRLFINLLSKPKTAVSAER